MNETSKCYSFRKSLGDFEHFLRGDGIDIGCGPDPLKIEHGSVRPWDLKDGDAQLMTGVADSSVDFVHSSYCLEHMRDVPETLFHWTRILRSGRHLYFAVPDYILYQKMNWASQFNGDHKQSFSIVIGRRQVQRLNHWHIGEDLSPIMAHLGLELVRVTLEDRGFNYNAGPFDQTARKALAQIFVVAKKADA